LLDRLSSIERIVQVLDARVAHLVDRRAMDAAVVERIGVDLKAGLQEAASRELLFAEGMEDLVRQQTAVLRRIELTLTRIEQGAQAEVSAAAPDDRVTELLTLVRELVRLQTGASPTVEKPTRAVKRKAPPKGPARAS
jgi:hypothetical protein